MATTVPKMHRPTEPIESSDTPTGRTARVVGWSAIAFALVPIPVIAVPHESLEGTESGAEIVAFFERHWAMQQWQPMMHLFSALALVVFVVSLTSLLRESERGSALWSQVARGAGLVMAAVIIVSMALVSSALALVGEPNASPSGDVVGGLYFTGWHLHFKINYIVPLFMAAIALVTLRGHAFSRVWGWLTAVLAVVMLASVFGNLSYGTYFVQFPAFMLLLVWSIGTGIMFLRRARRELRKERSTGRYTPGSTV